MQEKSSSARLFYKRAKKPKKKQFSFIFDSRSPKPPPPPPAPPVPVKANTCRFVNTLPPEYDAAKKGNCLKCGATTSMLWRKGPTGAETLCNSCGLRWKKAQRRNAQKAQVNNYSSSETGLKTKQTANLGTSHHILLQASAAYPAAREVETTAVEKYQQNQKDEQNGNIPNEQPRNKLALSFILN